MQVARVSLSSLVFKSCEMSYRAVGAQFGSAIYRDKAGLTVQGLPCRDYVLRLTR